MKFQRLREGDLTMLEKEISASGRRASRQVVTELDVITDEEGAFVHPQPEVNDMMTGEGLRMARRGLNLTQHRLAHLLDLTRVTVCLYENGHARVPRVVQLAMETLKARAGA